MNAERHATILTTQRYAHVQPQGIARTGDLMGGIATSAQTAAQAKAQAKVLPFNAAQGA